MSGLDLRQEAARAGRIHLIIWAAFLLVVVSYLVILLLTARERPARGLAEAPLATVRMIFYALGAGMLVASVLLRCLLDQRSYTYADEALRGSLLSLIVGLAMAESVAILGVVLAFLGGGWKDAVPFLVAGFAGVLLQRPDPDRLAERIRTLRVR
ncbi:MAG: hypothetical protein FJY88_03015 [Candidatus Eisenbacteria bacterium]|nr:hypothetical protein [Candidatus Eisenbacteria bacterium]